MTEVKNPKQYDLEDRTLKFALNVSGFCRGLKKDLVNIEYVKQLVRSSASIGANYIEANEALSKKDFLMRIKISRKEAKESIYWLNMLKTDSEEETLQLIDEASSLMKIFGAIVEKCK